MHYDDYDHYSLGIADSLPMAKRVAQAEYTANQLPKVARTLRWEAKSFTYRDKVRRYWIGPVNAYGTEYHIDKQEVITTREVP